MRVSVDHDRCMGTGNCSLIAPAVFDQRDDGLVLLKAERPDRADWDAARRALASCPTAAISIEEESGERDV